MNTAWLRTCATVLALAALVAAGARAQDLPEAPVITSITSPSEGTIVIRIQQLEPFDNGYSKNAFPSFVFYRAAGEVNDPAACTQFNPHSDPSDTVNMEGYVTGLVIRGLRAGTQTFYVKVSYFVRGTGVVHSPPSNLVTVTVGGSTTEDGEIIYSVQREQGAGVLPEAIPAFSAYPNPTRGILTLATPEPMGEAVVEAFDARGEVALRMPVSVADGACRVDVGALAPGAYTVVVQQGGRQTRSRITMIR